MSDPVTNSQVEDVLSSIRRLVGNNKRASTASETPEEPDRLVLTPQLRVASSEILRLEPEDAVSSAEEWYEFEEPPLPETIGYYLDDDAEDDEEAATESSQAEPEAQIEASEPEPEPESSTYGVAANSTAFTSSRSYSALTDKIAALETAIARTTDQWEPDGEEMDDYAGTRSPSLRWKEDVELDARGAPLTIKPLMPPSAAVADASDEQVLDEEMLRELVAEVVQQELQDDLVARIVRSELQGDLGARITRNIRKLVRREIQQALTARDLG